MTEIRPVQELASPQKKWTILIYQAGDNNLNEECVYALKEMKRVGTWAPGSRNGKPKSLMNVVIEFDPAGRANATRRFRIKGSGGDGTIVNDITEVKGETDTGKVKNLLDFLCESISENRTEHYMVILAGHGAGMREGFFLKDEERPLSSIPNSFPIYLLRKVFDSDRLKRVLGRRKIDILGFDACMMSMVEVCYELRSLRKLDLVLSSEGFTLNSGWPMDGVMEIIKSDPKITPDDLASAVVKDYVDHYRDYTLGGISVDQAVIKLSRIEDLTSAIDELAWRMKTEFEREAPRERSVLGNNRTEVEHDEGYYDEQAYKKTDTPPRKRPAYYYEECGRPFQDAVLLAHWAAQSYNGEQCVDLYDFCDLLQKRLPKEQEEEESSVWHACKRVKDVLRDSGDPTITKACFSGATFQYSYGASLYFPWADYDFAPSYRKLKFSKDCYWAKFLKMYLKATKRRPRHEHGFKRLEDNVRFTPPTNRGPSGMIFSMRNPPTAFWKMPCREKKKKNS